MTYTIKTNQGEIVVNDGILSNEEYQAIKIHRDRKNSLGNRLVILREYIKQSYNGNMARRYGSCFLGPLCKKH